MDTEKKWERRGSRLQNQNSNILTGILLLVVGGIFMLKSLDVDIPRWMYRWELFMVLGGIFLGIKRNFQGPGWFIITIIGAVSLSDVIFPVFRNPQFTWAAVAMIVGLYFIVKPKPGNGWWCSSRNGGNDSTPDEPELVTDGERLEAVSVFGNVRKVVVSKNFAGGETVAIMGGSDINLSQADIQGKVKFESVNIMGGSKLIIPPTWDVRSEMVAIFGGVEDKRDVHSLKIDPNKVLVLEGVCVFGGLEIRSY